MHQEEASLRFQKLRCTLHEIRQPCRRFVSGDRFRAVRIGQTALPLRVRRIAGHNIYAVPEAHSLSAAKVFDIGSKKLHTRLQPIALRATHRTLIGILLHLNAVNTAAVRLI